MRELMDEFQEVDAFTVGKKGSEMTKGRKTMAKLQRRTKQHDENLEKHNHDGRKKYTRPGSRNPRKQG